jgi:hypothetical protein
MTLLAWMENLIPNNVLFENSYVLNLRIEPYVLDVSMDFVLTSSHPAYSLPKLGEQECYKRGRIQIKKFQSLFWKASEIKPSRDAIGEIDYGNLDEFANESGKWQLSGDWGTIEIEGGELEISFEEK